MRCGACGHDNRETAAFCESCGSRLAPTCSLCAAELRPGARFCDACGHAQASATSSAATPTPQSYTPRHLAEKILASRHALEGERKQVTVLFADVVGSTELIQGRDAEEAQALLDGVVQVMMDAVHRYEGTVSRLTGDGLMALFGAPLAHEDHALRACYAALATHEAVRRHAERTRREQGISMAIRVGLSAGEVVVRTIRDDLHMDFTAMGQTVHLAARMEQLARPDTTALTPDTLALVEGYVQVRSLGPVPIKGLPEPMEAFELLGAGTVRTRLQAAATRGLTRFVGRDAEMAALYAALARAGAGQGQVAALVGEPGVGKSRVVWELTHSHRAEGWLVLESGSVSYGKATPYLPVIDLLKAYCRIEARDDARAVREKLTGKLLALDEALRADLPPLLALLDLPMDDPTWEALDPARRRRQTLDAVRRLLLRESREQPLLLIFEDLHWTDSETQALLDGLVESLPNARVLLLVNYRPEYRHEWGNRGYYTQLRIDPLAAECADELLTGLLGDDPSLVPLKAVLLARTGGNPLFLEELVRSLVESGELMGARGVYRPVRDLLDVQVPATVQAVLSARIDRLPTEEKRLLQIAAVIGKDVPDSLLHAVADRGEDELRRGLAVLQAAEFLYEASLFPEPEYTFKHALTHEVAYGSLLQERRKTLHARVLDTIERVYAARLEEQTERLSYHATRGERWERALAYAEQAGEKAMARSTYREAADAFEQALHAANQLLTSEELRRRSIDLRLMLATAVGGLSEHERALDHVREAEALASRIGDEGYLARVAYARSYFARPLGDLDGALIAARRARDSPSALSDLALWTRATLMVARLHQDRGEYPVAADLFMEVVAWSEENDPRDRFGLLSPPGTQARAMLVWTLAQLGDFGAAVGHAEAALRAAGETNNPYTQIMTGNIVGIVHLIRGHLDACIHLFERGRDLAAALDMPNLLCWASAELGSARALSGSVDEAVRLLRQAIDVADRTRLTDGRAVWLTWLGEACLLAGRIEEAAESAGEAVSIARARGERGYECHAVLVEGAIAASREPPIADEAESLYRRALGLADELEMRPLQAHCHLGLGKLYRRVGRSDEARAELSTAVAMLREMEMTHWLPEAEAEFAHVRASSR